MSHRFAGCFPGLWLWYRFAWGMGVSMVFFLVAGRVGCAGWRLAGGVVLVRGLCGLVVLFAGCMRLLVVLAGRFRLGV